MAMTRSATASRLTEGDPCAPSDSSAYFANMLNQCVRTESLTPSTFGAQGFRHDADGNLVELFIAADVDAMADLIAGTGANNSVTLTYTWDGENRLVKVEPTPGTQILSSAKRVTFKYD